MLHRKGENLMGILTGSRLVSCYRLSLFERTGFLQLYILRKILYTLLCQLFHAMKLTESYD